MNTWIETVTTIKPGYYEFPQDGNLVVLVRDGQMPQLEKEVLGLLNIARFNALHCEGWSILPCRAKIALIKEYLLKIVLSEQEAAKSAKEQAWEALKFLDKWVYDVYPFRDNRPDNY